MIKVKVVEVLAYYDNPLLVSAVALDDVSRKFLIVWLGEISVEDNFLRSLAVEVGPDDLVGVMSNVVKMRDAFTSLRIGPYYHGDIGGEGAETDLVAHHGPVPDDELPGDVTLYLQPKET